MAGNQYSKLSRGDEGSVCEFVRRENQSHESDARRRLITACVFCSVFIICEVIGEKLFQIFGPGRCNNK